MGGSWAAPSRQGLGPCCPWLSRRAGTMWVSEFVRGQSQDRVRTCGRSAGGQGFPSVGCSCSQCWVLPGYSQCWVLPGYSQCWVLPGWPVRLVLTGVPTLLWLPSLPFFPESPRSTLIQKRDEEEVRQGTGDTGCFVKTLPPCSLPSRLPVPAKHPSLVPEAENGQGAGWGKALHDAGTSGTGQRCRWHWGVQGSSGV